MEPLLNNAFLLLAMFSSPIFLQSAKASDRQSECGVENLVNHGDMLNFNTDASFHRSSSKNAVMQFNKRNSKGLSETFSPSRYRFPRPPARFEEMDEGRSYDFDDGRFRTRNNLDHESFTERYPYEYDSHPGGYPHSQEWNTMRPLMDEYSSKYGSDPNRYSYDIFYDTQTERSLDYFERYQHNDFEGRFPQRLHSFPPSSDFNHRRDHVPILYDNYFKKPENTHAGLRFPGKGGKRSERPQFPDMFQAMNRRYKRRKRNVQARDRLLAKKQKNGQLPMDKGNDGCTWRFFAGHNCQKLVVHITSGDTSKMKCAKEFISLSGDGGGAKKYCGKTRLQKTSVHGQKLSIEYSKTGGTSGEALKGWVTCN